MTAKAFGDDAPATIKRILRVNHAGEHGAIRIYRAQIAAARRLFPDLAAPLAEILAHEVAHETAFAQEMRRTGATPCRLVVLWSLGGAVLGLTSACFGRWGVAVCTAAVERAVHRHLEQQLAYLAGRDDALAAVIRAIQAEEVAHLEFALARHDPRSWPARAFGALVGGTTGALILATTRGESARMRRDIAASERVRPVAPPSPP